MLSLSRLPMRAPVSSTVIASTLGAVVPRSSGATRSFQKAKGSKHRVISLYNLQRFLSGRTFSRATCETFIGETLHASGEECTKTCTEHPTLRPENLYILFGCSPRLNSWNFRVTPRTPDFFSDSLSSGSTKASMMSDMVEVTSGHRDCNMSLSHSTFSRLPMMTQFGMGSAHAARLGALPEGAAQSEIGRGLMTHCWSQQTVTGLDSINDKSAPGLASHHEAMHRCEVEVSQRQESLCLVPALLRALLPVHPSQNGERREEPPSIPGLVCEGMKHPHGEELHEIASLAGGDVGGVAVVCA